MSHGANTLLVMHPPYHHPHEGSHYKGTPPSTYRLDYSTNFKTLAQPRGTVSPPESRSKSAPATHGIGAEQFMLPNPQASEKVPVVSLDRLEPEMRNHSVSSDDDDDEVEADAASHITTDHRTGECLPLETGRWSSEEHERFLEGLKMYGRRKWQKIAELVGTRTTIQVRSHAQKYFKKLRKESEHANQPSFGGSRTHSKVRSSNYDDVTSDENIKWLIAADAVSSQQHHHRSSSSSSNVGEKSRGHFQSNRRELPEVRVPRSQNHGHRNPFLSRTHQVARATISEMPTWAEAEDSKNPELAAGRDSARKRRTLDDLCAVASLMLEDADEQEQRAKRPSLGDRSSLDLDSPPISKSKKLPLSRCPTVEVYDHNDKLPPIIIPERLELPVPYRTAPFAQA